MSLSHVVSLTVNVYRGRLIESSHRIIGTVKDIKGNYLISTNNEKDLIYPRSSIKIFQALPFIISKTHKKFDLNKKIIAISCSSHVGEPQHLRILNEWIKKININIKDLKCGTHNPIDLLSSNKLLLSGKIPTQLHNNCAGKHLAMISGCLANKMNYYNYIDFDHPYQKLIRNSLEKFTGSKIKNNCIGIDGCSAPQYAFTLDNLSDSMINLIKEKNKKNEYSKAINTILLSIKKFPEMISGNNCFDSNVMKITKGRLFCKGGAEGVVLFADFSKKIGGAIKVLDGGDRAKFSIVMEIFSKLNLILNDEKKLLENWKVKKILNHANKKVGEIVAKIN